MNNFYFRPIEPGPRSPYNEVPQRPFNTLSLLDSNSSLTEDSEVSMLFSSSVVTGTTCDRVSHSFGDNNSIFFFAFSRGSNDLDSNPQSPLVFDQVDTPFVASREVEVASSELNLFPSLQDVFQQKKRLNQLSQEFLSLQWNDQDHFFSSDQQMMQEMLKEANVSFDKVVAMLGQKSPSPTDVQIFFKAGKAFQEGIQFLNARSSYLASLSFSLGKVFLKEVREREEGALPLEKQALYQEAQRCFDSGIKAYNQSNFPLAHAYDEAGKAFVLALEKREKWHPVLKISWEITELLEKSADTFLWRAYAVEAGRLHLASHYEKLGKLLNSLAQIKEYEKGNNLEMNLFCQRGGESYRAAINEVKNKNQKLSMFLERAGDAFKRATEEIDRISFNEMLSEQRGEQNEFIKLARFAAEAYQEAAQEWSRGNKEEAFSKNQEADLFWERLEEQEEFFP